MAQDPAGCGGFPRLHKRAVALAESKLVSVSVDGARVRVLLDALVHVSQGRPGRDGGTSWEQPVELVLGEATVETPVAADALPLWLEGGALSLEGAPSAPAEGREAALVAVPQHLPGAVRLHLWAEGAALTVSGRGLWVEEKGAARFVERFEGDART
jgi:hypothetical protein